MAVSRRGMAVFQYRRKPMILLALLALLVAQAAAGLHALQHFGKQGDPLGVPGHHAQLCLECASFASLGAAHGGTVTALAVMAVAGDGLTALFTGASPARAVHSPSRSRAPPR